MKKTMTAATNKAAEISSHDAGHISRLARRKFLAQVGVLAAGALVPVGELWSQGVTSTANWIDMHHHFGPPKWCSFLASKGLLQASWNDWTPSRSVEELDHANVSTAFVSITYPGIWLGENVVPVDATRAMARDCNDYGAKMLADYPGRFGLFAVLPLPDIDGSLREIEYALDTLKADGIGLMTSYGDKWLGNATFAPVWEQLNRRKALVYTHPNTPACCGNIADEVGAVTIEWATDTTRTVASLLFSGTAARYPEIRWIFSHGGGTTPFLLSRFVYQEATMKGKESVLPKGLMYELKKFYYDTAQANHPGALAALLKMVTPSQILFGTDFPFRTAGEVIGGLSAWRFPAKDLMAIERNNAMGLMPELRG